MSNPDIIKNAPTSPGKSPSDSLLKNFQATLEKRWTEFDIATMKEAQFQVSKHPLGWFTDAQTERAKDANFIKAKAAFDQARSSLSAISDDTGLKQILNSPGNLLSAIQTLEAHFAAATAPEKAKEYNHVLANTLADLTSLKSQVTDTAEDKKSAEVAAIAVKAMPAVAIAAVATGWVESLLSSSDTKGLVNEWTKEVKNGIKSAIAEFLGFDKKTMIEDMAKRVKWESIGFMGTIRVMIFALLNKIYFLGLTDDWSPEEMKLAGLGGKAEWSKWDKQEIVKEAEKKWSEKLVKDKAYVAMTSHLINRNNRKVLNGFFDSVEKWVWEGTWGKDEQKTKDDMINQAKVTLTLDSIADAPFSQLKSDFSGNYSIEKMAKKYQISGKKEMDGLALAMRSLIENESWIDGNLKANPDWRDKPISVSLNSLYKGIGFTRIENLQTALTAIDWSQPNQFWEKIKTLLISSKDGKFSGLIGDHMESMKSKWFSPEIASRIFTNDAEWNQTIEVYRKTLAGHRYTGDSTQSLMTEITKPNGFARSMNELFAQYDLGWYMGAYNNWEWLSIKQVTSLYLITWWETNIEKMSPGMRSEVYMTLLTIVGKDSPWALSGDMLLQFFDAPTSPYVWEFVEFVWVQMNKATYTATLGAMWFATETIDLLWKMREKNPKTFYGVIAATIGAAILAIYLRKPIAIGLLTATILAVGAKIWIIEAVSTQKK